MSRSRGIKGVLALVAILIVATLVPIVAQSADHADAPAVGGDAAADITDVYAFRSPMNADNLVVALNVNPLSVPGDTARVFASDVSYQIHVDNTGDLVADATVTVTFSASDSDGTQTFSIAGLGGTPITGKTTRQTAGLPEVPNITDAGGIKIFAGPRDDPFFFDLIAYQTFLAGPFVPAAGLRAAGDPPSDTLAGSNISAIVIELPIVALTGAADSNTGTIRTWATTSRGGGQIDRMAIPAVNTVLIPSAEKDAYNLADPANDVSAYLSTAQATIEALRGAVGSVDGFPAEDDPGIAAAALAGILIPDVVTIDFSKPVQFTNGRTLEDDVIDAALGLVLNRAGVGDGVGGNDVAFLGAFPYLAGPHAPAILPATGDSVPEGWMVVAAVVGGMALLFAGGWLLMRRRTALARSA